MPPVSLRLLISTILRIQPTMGPNGWFVCEAWLIMLHFWLSSMLSLHLSRYLEKIRIQWELKGMTETYSYTYPITSTFNTLQIGRCHTDQGNRWSGLHFKKNVLQSLRSFKLFHEISACDSEEGREKIVNVNLAKQARWACFVFNWSSSERSDEVSPLPVKVRHLPLVVQGNWFNPITTRAQVFRFLHR